MWASPARPAGCRFARPRSSTYDHGLDTTVEGFRHREVGFVVDFPGTCPRNLVQGDTSKKTLSRRAKSARAKRVHRSRFEISSCEILSSFALLRCVLDTARVPARPLLPQESVEV